MSEQPHGDDHAGDDEAGDDHDGLVSTAMKEIHQEALARRASGELPPSFEQELDAIFMRCAPERVQGDHLEEMMRLADRSAYIDIEVPVHSRKPGVRTLKRVLRRLMSWYLNYVVQQVMHFTSSTMRVLHVMHERVGELEMEAESSRPDLLGDEQGSGPDLSHWKDLVLRHLAGASGPVLHADCGDGSLAEALGQNGVDVYGLETRSSALDRAAARGVDVRRGALDVHLRTIDDSSLGGLLLSGCVDRLPVRAQRALVAGAAAKLRDGSPVVLLCTSPNAWARSLPPVDADLAPGRPLHPDTWCRLLADAGFQGVSVEWGPEGEALERIAGDDPATKALNANLDRLERALFGPASFAVVAVAAS